MNTNTRAFPRSLAVAVALALGLFASLLAPVEVFYGQEELPTWSAPLALSSRDPSSWFPDVAADPSGRVHVVWSSAVALPGDGSGGSTNAEADVVMYTASEDGETWSDPVDVVAFREARGREATRPGLLVDGAALWLTYRSKDVFVRQAATERATSASAWVLPRQLSSGSEAYYSRMASDRDGALHVVYTGNMPSPDCAICYHVLYRRSVDGGRTWSAATDVSVLPTGAVKPQLLVDEEGDLHLVWEAGRGGSLGQLEKPTRVLYAASYDKGETWTLPLEFRAPNGQARNPALAIDGQGRLMAVWIGLPEERVYFQVSTDRGRSWSEPTVIEGVFGFDSRLDGYSMVADSAGDVHLAMVGRTFERQKEMEVLNLTWNATERTWSLPQSIAKYDEDLPEWPRLAVSGGNRLLVVWFVRDAANIFRSESGRYQVWYSQGQTSAPEFPLQGTEPSTTQAAAEATDMPTRLVLAASPAVSTTQVPAMQGMEPVVQEADVLLVILKSLVPTVLFLLAALVGVRLWRR